ncbi:MAG TPA: Fic family protein, partial [Pyrinomonadaceae bacterium]
MTELLDTRAADAAYQSFPSFQEWQRNVVVDVAKWDRFTEKLTLIKDGATPQLLEKAKEVVKRATAWDTGSLEGLYDTNIGVTMTIALENSLWENMLSEKGEDAIALFAAQLHAYSYVLDFATQAVHIIPTWIRQLHAELCAPQKTYKALTPQGYQNLTLPKGEYKALPNHVIGRDDKPHYYAPVDITPTEVDRLCNEMQTATFLNAHPVLQASYVHYAFVLIHPFADGNGRVARALASVFTYRALSVPLLILLESRSQYLSALMQADAGNYQPFVDFVMERAFDSIRVFEESVLS